MKFIWFVFLITKKKEWCSPVNLFFVAYFQNTFNYEHFLTAASVHKKLIPNFSLSILNKKLIEVFVYILVQFKTNEKMGSSHQGFFS